MAGSKIWRELLMVGESITMARCEPVSLQAKRVTLPKVVSVPFFRSRMMRAFLSAD